MAFLWIIVNITTIDIGSRIYVIADARTWRMDVRSEWGLSNFLKNMILRTFLNICTSHRFRPLLLSFVVSQRESSSMKEGHFTKDSEHVFSRNKCVYELYSPIILTVVIGALFHGERVLCELSLISLLLVLCFFGYTHLLWSGTLEEGINDQLCTSFSPYCDIHTGTYHDICCAQTK